MERMRQLPPRFEVVTPVMEHVHGLANVHVQGWRDAYGTMLPETFYDDTALERRRSSWAALLSTLRADQIVRAAVADGHVIGFSFVGPAQDENLARDLELYSLYVLSAWYGTGVAAVLLEGSLRGQPAQLWVAKQNARAIAFYRKQGFDLDGTEKVEPKLHDLVEVRMVR